MSALIFRTASAALLGLVCLAPCWGAEPTGRKSPACIEDSFATRTERMGDFYTRPEESAASGPLATEIQRFASARRPARERNTFRNASAANA